MILQFGKHKSREVKDCPESYWSWLIHPMLKDKTFFNVPDDIRGEAQKLLEMRSFVGDRFTGKPSPSNDYLIERLGDIDGLTIHNSLQEALAQLELEYPFSRDFDERCTPDPEDDRILIWEILPSGHRRVVWHFSGWHWDTCEFWGLEQGSLSDDTESLYCIGCG